MVHLDMCPAFPSNDIVDTARNDLREHTRNLSLRVPARIKPPYFQHVIFSQNRKVVILSAGIAPLNFGVHIIVFQTPGEKMNRPVAWREITTMADKKPGAWIPKRQMVSEFVGTPHTPPVRQHPITLWSSGKWPRQARIQIPWLREIIREGLQRCLELFKTARAGGDVTWAEALSIPAQERNSASRWHGPHGFYVCNASHQFAAFLVANQPVTVRVKTKWPLQATIDIPRQRKVIVPDGLKGIPQVLKIGNLVRHLRATSRRILLGSLPFARLGPFVYFNPTPEWIL